MVMPGKLTFSTDSSMTAKTCDKRRNKVQLHQVGTTDFSQHLGPGGAGHDGIHQGRQCTHEGNGVPFLHHGEEGCRSSTGEAEACHFIETEAGGGREGKGTPQETSENYGASFFDLFLTSKKARLIRRTMLDASRRDIFDLVNLQDAQVACKLRSCTC